MRCVCLGHNGYKSHRGDVELHCERRHPIARTAGAWTAELRCDGLWQYAGVGRRTLLYHIPGSLVQRLHDDGDDVWHCHVNLH